jgi:hypothetical protein
VDTYVLLGSTSGSDRAGSAEHDWHLKVYRHPELQAMTTDYNFGHDIYALGVCLLEIGLWTALVLPPAANSKVQVASKKLLSAGGVVLVDRLEKELKEALNSQPEGMVLSALKEAACSTVASLLLEKVLDMLGVDGNNEADAVTKFRNEASQTLRKESCECLVVKCLTCLEGCFGAIDFKTMEQEDACITLEAEIVVSLRRVNLGV